MAAKFTPRPYQVLGAAHIQEHPRCALWLSMGMGKTVTTAGALDILELAGAGAWPALVIAPLRVARRGWPNELGKWDHLRHLRASAIVGTTAERRAALRRPAELYTINYDNLPWLLEELGAARWPFRTVVADESTRLKGFRLRQGGQRARALGQVAHTRVDRFIELTGTPSPNGLADLWGQLWFLDAGQRLGRTFEGFKDRWFQTLNNADGFGQLRVLPFAQEQIQDRLRDICLTLDPRDYFDIKEPVRTIVEVELPAKVRDTYAQFERELFMQIGGQDIEVFNTTAKTMKLLQLVNGAVYLAPDDGSDAAPWAEVHDAKIQALAEVIEEAAGMPVLVAYQFKSDLARLRKAFPTGRWLADDNEFDQFLTGRYPVGFAHPASMGHGVDGLQDVTNIIAFFGHWWDLELRQQIIERIGPVRQLQSGHDRPVFIYDIAAVDTIDEVVLALHQSKRAVQDLLLEAMKRRKQ